MYVYKPDKCRVPIKVWQEKGAVEQGALDQIELTAQLPFAFHHVALMPDAHQGYGMPIGGVFAAEGVVLPYFVGVDIGCGMCAVKTTHILEKDYEDDVKTIMSAVRDSIPLGRDHHKDGQEWIGFDEALYIKVIQSELASARRQLGTLGGGNHFIEVQVDEDNYVWLMLHSGSRNFGFKIAKEYHARAQEHCEKWHVSLPDKDLAFLPIGECADTTEYLDAMNFALKFAEASRALMMERFVTAANSVWSFYVEDPINIHHNYAAIENHFGKNVWVHRKGATSAREGQLGIIPGSQGTASYIVEGLGNSESFMSCSHGAGRTMSRSKARAELDLEAEKKMLDDQGIVHSIRSQGDLDEAPSAYKDIENVMEQEKDLVKIVAKLRPIGVVKG